MTWSRWIACACALLLLACSTIKQAAPPAAPEARAHSQPGQAQAAAEQPAASTRGGDLLSLLPQEAALQSLDASGEPLQIDSEEGLYAQINGGAGTFVENGFQGLLVQEYRAEAGGQYSLELFDMGSPANAEKIFTLRGGDPAAELVAGQGSTLEDYYGLFWQGRYFITITAYDPDEQTREILTRIAADVVARIVRG